MQRWMQENARLLNRSAVIGLIAAVAVIIWMLPVREMGRLLHSWTERLGPWGYVVYTGAYLAMSVLSIPVWTMPFIAGAAFGTLWGTVISSACCVGGAALCFGIARALRGTWLERWAESSPRMQAFERVVEEGNWKVVGAVRLAHLLTFGMQNYAFGLTKVDFRTFLFTTWAVTLPGTTLQVYLGDLGFTSLDAWQSQQVDWKAWSLRAGGLIVMVSAVVYLGMLGRRLYRDTIAGSFEAALKEESAVRDGRWPWGTIGLSACCLLLAGTAVWCAAHREAMREFIERQEARGGLEYSAAKSGLARSR